MQQLWDEVKYFWHAPNANKIEQTSGSSCEEFDTFIECFWNHLENTSISILEHISNLRKWNNLEKLRAVPSWQRLWGNSVYFKDSSEYAFGFNRPLLSLFEIFITLNIGKILYEYIDVMYSHWHLLFAVESWFWLSSAPNKLKLGLHNRKNIHIKMYSGIIKHFLGFLSRIA